MPDPVEWKIESAEAVCPRCPSCYDETEYGDGWFVCRPCGIAWDDDRFYSEPGFFDDSEAQPCGVEEPDEKTQLDGFTRIASPCLLPEGHETKEHYHLHRYQRIAPPPLQAVVDVPLPDVEERTHHA